MNNLRETVKAVLAKTTTHWLSMTETLPEDLLVRSPLPNEWSVMDCLCHLVDAERWIFPMRVHALLARDFALIVCSLIRI